MNFQPQPTGRATFDEGGLRAWAEKIARRTRANARFSLGPGCFMSPKFFSKRARQTLGNFAPAREDSRCSRAVRAQVWFAGSKEIEKRERASSLALYSLPGAELKRFFVLRQTQSRGKQADKKLLAGGIRRRARQNQTAGLRSLIRFISTRESWIRSLERIVCAVADFRRNSRAGIFSGGRRRQVYLNGEVFEDGRRGGFRRRRREIVRRHFTGLHAHSAKPGTLTRVEQKPDSSDCEPPGLTRFSDDTFKKTFTRRPAKVARKSFHRPSSSTNTLRIFIAAIFSCGTSSAAIQIPASWPSAALPRARGRRCNFTERDAVAAKRGHGRTA